MIDISMIRKGLENKSVLIKDCPYADCPVCSIGEYWFYFGGSYKGDTSAETFLANHSKEEIALDIYTTLNEFKNDYYLKDEYNYYEAYLKEVLSMKAYLVWKRDNHDTLIDEVLKIFLDEEKAKKWLTEYAEKWNLTRLDDYYLYEYTDGDCDYFIVTQEVEE